jgi:glycerol kinase
MAEAVLSIDAGTTNVRALVVGADGIVRGQAMLPQTLQYPAPGLVEMDPEGLWRATQQTITQALDRAGLSAGDLAAVGITGQRTTIIVWERKSGRPLGPAISWQDQRGAKRAQELYEKGFFTNAIAAASKLESAVDAIPDGRRRMMNGELAWGKRWPSPTTASSCSTSTHFSTCRTGISLSPSGWNPAATGRGSSFS